MLLGLLRPTEGHAAIAGFHSNEFPDEVKRRVGLVSANTGLYQWLTAREMLLFFADLYGVPQDEARQRLSKLSELLGVSEYLDRRCATLSTGQKQRVNLARALIHDPPVVLLDEPTLGLDVIGSQVINEYVEHLRDKGHAVIVCTHRLDEAERLCNRFGLLHRGRIVSEGTLAELRERIGCQTLVEMFIRVSQIGRVLAAHPARGALMSMPATPAPLPEPPRPRATLGRLSRLTLKELREILRDRRTIVTLVLMPLLVYPLLSVGFRQFFLTRVASELQPTFRVGFPDEAQGHFFRTFLVEHGAAVDELPTAVETASLRTPTVKYYAFDPLETAVRIRRSRPGHSPARVRRGPAAAHVGCRCRVPRRQGIHAWGKGAGAL